MCPVDFAKLVEWRKRYVWLSFASTPKPNNGNGGWCCVIAVGKVSKSLSTTQPKVVSKVYGTRYLREVQLHDDPDRRNWN